MHVPAAQCKPRAGQSAPHSRRPHAPPRDLLKPGRPGGAGTRTAGEAQRQRFGSVRDACRLLKAARSAPHDDLNALLGDRSRQEQVRDEVVSNVSDLVEIDRTAELLLYLFSSLFGRKEASVAQVGAGGVGGAPFGRRGSTRHHRRPNLLPQAPPVDHCSGASLMGLHAAHIGHIAHASRMRTCLMQVEDESKQQPGALSSAAT
jgi:hypothetical protein